MKKLHYLPFLAALALTTVLAPAESEIGFVEKFALAKDREAVLAQLIPASEEYYFYHALHYQNTAQQEKLDAIMALWVKRFPKSPQRRVIENRAALLAYNADPQTTLKFLRDRLNLQFNHQRQARDQKPDLPSDLNPTLISRDVYLREALRQSDAIGTFGAATDEALVRDKVTLTVAQRRVLLARLTRPDVPNLLDLIVADLQSRESNGNFGEFGIHRQLLPEQLDELARRMPQLLENQTFIATRVRKLAPSADADVEFDPAEREAWLDRVWAYVAPLTPTFNSLKANILYQRLQLDRSRGTYDQARFLEYLKLPRRTSYANPRYLESGDQVRYPVNLNSNFTEAMPSAGPIGNDDALVRDYFLHIFPRLDAAVVGQDPVEILKPWTPYVREAWLRPVLAEAMITNGVGDPERWASLLNPAIFQALKDRVDIDFAATNPQFRTPAEEVNLDLFIKNAPKVIVKLYEVNTLSYFLTQHRQLNTDLPLEGLVANKETTFDYANEAEGRSPFRRVSRHFTFPELKDKRGAWVIEFIGGGKSSRALVRKGQWTLIQRTGPAGDQVTVLDDDRKPVKDAAVWLEGRRYVADEKTGRVNVPFTSQPGRKPIILADATGGFATLAQFEHHSEAYRLNVTFHIEREQLLAGREATLVLRPALLLNDAQISTDLLGDKTLSITSINMDGVETTTEVRDPKFEPTKDFTYKLRVPDRLASVTVILKAKIANMSQGGAKQDLAASAAWSVNGIDLTDRVADSHLSRFGGNYVYEYLGKNGEPLADQAVSFVVAREGFSQPVYVSLATDAKGRVMLGTLEGIASVQATPPNQNQATWRMVNYHRTQATEIHAIAQTEIMVPWGRKVEPGTISLLETRNGAFTSDRSANVSAPVNADGEAPFLIIKDLPPGDYSLALDKGALAELATIRVTAGEMVDGWIESPTRALQVRDGVPLQIDSVAVEKEVVRIKLANAGKFARVHVAATRFLPSDGLLQLGEFTRFEPGWSTPDKLPNLFAAGRDIGDEYRYILERRYAKIFPGNMLTRPGLLLNPWEVKATDLQNLQMASAQLQSAMGGARAGKSEASGPQGSGRASLGDTAQAGETNLDFLATSCPIVFNLTPDENGVIQLDRAALGDRQYIQVYAEDLNNAVWKTVALEEVPTKFTDLRLAHALDPQKPFTEKKETTLLNAGQSLTLADVRTSELESYDTLAGIHALFTTLNPDAKLALFSWILQWPTLKEEEKRAKYSEFACHELNFFLSRKDPEFFQRVIAPYLKNKKDKTFMDDYLLGNDLHPYLDPWAYARLNVAEQALLGRRLPEETAATARALQDRWDMLTPNPERLNVLFETALRGRALQAGGGRAFDDLKSNVSAVAAPMANAPASPPTMTDLSLQSDGTVMRAGEKNLRRSMMPAKRADEAQMALRTNAMSMSETTQAWSQEAPPGSTRVAGVAAAKPMESAKDQAQKQLEEQDKDANSTLEAASAVEARQEVRQFFRALGPTMEWAENNYYKLPISAQDGSLVAINAFWRDFAAWDGKSAFISAHVAEATSNFTEMMLALGVLDLPFDAPKNTTKGEGAQFTLTAAGPLIAFHKEIKPATPAKGGGALLVSQNFFRQDDPYREEGNEKFEKYVTDEFLAGVVYGAKVVVTNPTSSPQKLDVLMQIPQGALPVLKTKPTDSEALRLEPYTTKVYQYAFYFPAPAEKPFPQFPVNVARDEESVAAAKPAVFQVVQKLSQVDTASWEYVSQEGSDDDVFNFLAKANLDRVDLTKVAWRERTSIEFFRKMIALLSKRHVYNDVLYSYAVVHNDAHALGEWLQHNDSFIAQCGPWLSTKLLTIDPIVRRSYEHLEYSPLVNQRTHRVGAENRIANPVLLAQYQELMNILAYKKNLDAIDQMSVVYYLFLQDRVEEALAMFHEVKADALPTKLQHDYFRCYAAFYEENLGEARTVAAQYADFPVDRWRKIFADVSTQLAEIEGKPAPAGTTPSGDGKPDREAQQGELAATEPTFDFKVEDRKIALSWKNLKEVTVNYYLMDPEFLFSSSPFVTQDPSRFSIIKPSTSAVVALPEGKDATDLPLPDEYAKANVLVEILGAGQRKAQAYHANTLTLNLAENYGRLELRDQGDGKPVSKAYVKVYARLRNGAVRFYKDGYTDLRGKFDYASLNSSQNQIPVPYAANAANAGTAGSSMNYQMLKPDELNDVEKLAILIMSEKEGTLVREVSPPSQ